MWPFKTKTSLDYIQQIIRISKKINPGKIKKIILLVQSLGIKQLQKIEEETGSKTLQRQCTELLRLIKKVDPEDIQAAKIILEKINLLESIIQKDIFNIFRNFSREWSVMD